MRTKIYTLVRFMYSLGAYLTRPLLTKRFRLRMQTFTVPLLYKLAPKTDGAFEIHGHKMFLKSGEKLPPVNMSMDTFEEATTQLFERLIKPGMTVIDVGAHVGYYTMIAARAAGPDGKVFAFEPDESNYSVLVKNIEMNGYENVTAMNQGVSNFVGSSTLVLNPWHSGIHHLEYGNEIRSNGVVVATTSIDALLEANGSPKVDFVKIDVEGSEDRVLDGMQRLLKQPGKLNVILEFHPPLLVRSEVDPREFLGRLIASNCEIRVVDGDNSLIHDIQSELDEFVEKVWENGVNLLCTFDNPA